MAASRLLKLNPAELDFEYKMLMDELDSLDSLYTEAKSRLDAVSKIPSRANPVFMASQTANLISIKEKRLNIIKELTNIKKAKMEMETKMFTANNKLDEQNSGVSKDILDLYNLINGKNNDIIEEDIEINQPTDEEIDKIFEERLNEDNINKKKETKNKQTLPSEYSIVCTKNKELYIIDSDYNIIDDLDFDTSVIKIIEFTTNNDGEEIAIDEDNNFYEVVEIWI